MPCQLKKKKDIVVIVGRGRVTRNLVDYEREDCEYWGVNDAYNYMQKVDVIFQLHERDKIESFSRDKEHFELIKSLNIPIVTVKKWSDIPNSVSYPWKEVISVYGDYFTNSISEMIALALYMKYKRIELYGCDFVDEREKRLQLPSITYYIGMARGHKIASGIPEVYIPPQSPILKTLFVYGRDGSSGLIDKLYGLKMETEDIEQINKVAERNARDKKYEAIGAIKILEKIFSQSEEII